MRVIALEEAFLHPKLREFYKPSYLKWLDMIRDRLSDVGPERIRRMDAAGIDLQVLSHVAPGVQTLDREPAIHLSREVNDWLGDIVGKYPTRFAGFAMLPTQAPQIAADELERTVTHFGFKGAMINAHTHGLYLDDPSFSPILETAEALNVPIYIHPFDPPQGIIDIYYKDRASMIQGWGWQVEVGTHLLRMIVGGVFERYPNLKVIIGHMGELIPFGLDRINRTLTIASWLLSSQSKDDKTAFEPMRKSVRYYMNNNVFITTSGTFDQLALDCAVAELGIDHVLFSIDDPFVDNFDGVAFLKKARLSREDKHKFAHGNAERILKLSPNTKSETKSGWSFYALQATLKAKIARMLLSFLLK